MRHDIAELDLKSRTYNCLKQAGIHYVEEIMDMTDADLMAVRHLGVSCLRDVREKLASWNPHLTYQELEERNARLVKLIDSMLTDYLCCADDRYSLFHAMHKGRRSVYRPEGKSILARIGETYDGIKINGYLDQMKELGHEL